MSVKTFAGIDNFFFLEKMYGTTDIFSNAELYLLSVFWADCRVNLEIDVDIYEQSENGERKVNPFLLQNLLEQYKEIAHQIQEIVDLEAED